MDSLTRCIELCGVIMNDELQFQCQVCGEAFEAESEAMIEVHFTAEEESPEEEESRRGSSGSRLHDELEEQLRLIDLTEEDQEKLMAGEEVVIGAVCLCRECRELLPNEAEE
jgi:hypothetical protein